MRLRNLLAVPAALALLALLSTGAAAQQTVKVCVPTTSNASGVNVTSCQDVTATNGVPISSGVADGTASASTNGSKIMGSRTTDSLLEPVRIDANGNTLVVVPSVDPCQTSNIAKTSVVIGITSATTTALVAVSGTTAVYVCGFVVTISEVVTTANTIAFEYGTGAACATGPTALTGTFGAGGVTAAPPITVSYGGAGQTVFKTPASAGLCALTAIGASGSFQGVLTYVQQ